jgi:hypothetical protein
MDYLPKDPAILVSSINMLLRDEEFDTLEAIRSIYDLCRIQSSDVQLSGSCGFKVNLRSNKI